MEHQAPMTELSLPHELRLIRDTVVCDLQRTPALKACLHIRTHTHTHARVPSKHNCMRTPTRNSIQKTSTHVHVHANTHSVHSMGRKKATINPFTQSGLSLHYIQLQNTAKWAVIIYIRLRNKHILYKLISYRFLTGSNSNS